MLVNGYVTDWLVKGEWLRLKAVRSALLRDVLFCRLYAGRTTSDNIHDGGSADWHGTVLYSLCRNILLGLDPRRSCFSHDCVGGQYQNFASFICASFAPIITGFIVDTTHSFRLALIICGCVTAAGALAYIFLVRQPINDPRKD